MKNIKMILCDLDGTLLNSSKTVSKENIEAIQYARSKGILFGIATGRSLHGVKKLIKDWQIADYCDFLIGFNGAHLIDFSLNIDQTYHLLDSTYAKKIAEHFKNIDCNVIVYDDQYLYATKDDEIAHGIAKGNYFTYRHLDVDSFFSKKDYMKLIIACKNEVMPQVISHAALYQDQHFRSFQSTPNLYEYVNPKVSKTYGINEACKLHGFTLDQVMVFGDASNDIEMLSDCGIGVCMENGDTCAKEVADYITSSNDENGVAKFILENI